MNHCLTAPFQTLRVSLTDQCDLKCQYCVDPNKTLGRCQSAPLPLSAPQMAQAVRLLLRNAPLKEIKLTGGEPLLGHHLEHFLEALGPQPALEINLTTNGQQLAGKLDLLKRFGINRVNISLDSLDPECFKELTGGHLEKTLEGLEQALAQGFQVKLNMVPLAGINDSECLSMFEFAAQRGIQVRYIELMEMGHLFGEDFREKLFDRQQILEQISKKHCFTEKHRPEHGTAELFEVSGLGKFGIIANHSQPFCNDCDRLRLSATGKLVGCLSSELSYGLRDLLQLNETEADRAVKPLLYAAFGTKQQIGFTGSRLAMKAIGG